MTRKLEQQVLQRFARAQGVDAFALAQLLQSHGISVRFAHATERSLANLDVTMATLTGPKTAELTSAFLGLTGAVSPLPQETAAALEDISTEDSGQGLAAFAALVHHRVLSLLHEGVAVSLPNTSITTHCADGMSQQLMSSSAYADGLAPHARLGVFAALHKPHCNAQDIAWAVAAVLRRRGFQAPTTCQALTGGTLPIDRADQWQLGSHNSVAGETAVLGHEAWAPAQKITVRIGPVSQDWLLACSLEGDAVAEELAAMLRATLPSQVRADVEVAVAADACAPWRLQQVCGAQDSNAWQRPPNPLGGLGAQTFLGARTAPQIIPWPLATALDGWSAL